MDQAPGEKVRPRAGRRALHRHRHLAPQPDARLRLKENDLREIMPKQAMILDQAQRLVKPGGRLIYATCSLLDAENEAQLEAFLARTPNFKRIDLTDPLPASLHGPALRLTPRSHGTDGFFGAILERIN